MTGAGQGNADAIEAGSGSFGRLREDARAAALERCLKGVTATAKLLRADPPLRSLHLCKCGLGNLSVRAVAESLMANSHLHELLLGENAIGEPGRAAEILFGARAPLRGVPPGTGAGREGRGRGGPMSRPTQHRARRLGQTRAGS